MTAQILGFTGTKREGSEPVRNSFFYTPCDSEGLPTTSAHNEMVIRVSFLDAQGRLQYNVTRSTRSLASPESRQLLKDRMSALYRHLGGELLTLELVLEHSRTLIGPPLRSKLHVIRLQA